MRLGALGCGRGRWWRGLCLTLGIAMGSWWAYYELGWGGWWFWDPVENASFMPWLAGTALLHSALVMEKREALARSGPSCSRSWASRYRSGHLPGALGRADVGACFRRRSGSRDRRAGAARHRHGVGFGLYAWRAPKLAQPAASQP
jgi:hypothetical protein